MQRLSEAALRKICQLDFLDLKDLYNCSLVCRGWNIVVSTKIIEIGLESMRPLRESKERQDWQKQVIARHNFVPRHFESVDFDPDETPTLPRVGTVSGSVNMNVKNSFNNSNGGETGTNSTQQPPLLTSQTSIVDVNKVVQSIEHTLLSGSSDKIRNPDIKFGGHRASLLSSSSSVENKRASRNYVDELSDLKRMLNSQKRKIQELKELKIEYYDSDNSEE